MQPMQNRMGLGLRPPMPSYGQGPPVGSLGQPNLHPMGMGAPPPNFIPPSQQRTVQLFVGSISGGIQDPFLNDLLSACGSVKSFKRLITPANKPQGFGFAEYEDPDGALRAIELLNGVELPALEDGCANKKLLVKPDEKTRAFLDAYGSQKMKTDTDEQKIQDSRSQVANLVDKINKISNDAADSGLLDKERYVIPPHLHDLQEADLPETQRGLVISEIAQFRERAAKKERERAKENGIGPATPTVGGMGMGPASGPRGAPSGPKMREWGKPQHGQSPSPMDQQRGGFGKGPQGYDKPVNFVRGEDNGKPAAPVAKTDEELEQDRKEARKREEENSFRDRERRYEPRERNRIQAIERTMARERAQKEAEERDRIEMKSRLEVWDDDESDELFYVDRARWRQLRSRRLAAEEEADAKSRRFEEQEAENLKKESEEFLARQMDEMQALAEEQRKAGLLLDDGAPVRLNVALSNPTAAKNPPEEGKKTVFVQDEEDEEEGGRKRKAPLVKLDFSSSETPEQMQERLERVRVGVPNEKEPLFKAKVRWDGMTDQMIDRKFEPLINKLMVKYLGDVDEDLILFILEHLKDHKTPQKLVEGLEPVLEEDAVAFTVSIWRQIIFESMAYGEGLLTDNTLVDAS